MYDFMVLQLKTVNHSSVSSENKDFIDTFSEQEKGDPSPRRSVKNPQDQGFVSRCLWIFQRRIFSECERHPLHVSFILV